MLEKTYHKVDNPLHGASVENGSEKDLESASVTRKSLLDGSVQRSHDVESIKKEKPKYDYSGNYAVVLLFIVGCFSGVLINTVLWGVSMLSLMQAKLIVSNPAGGFCYVLTTAALSALAAYVCKISGRVATIGSGIPEVKALLTNDFHPSELSMIVSSRIGYTRMVGIVMALGSGLSIGSAAPLVHMTVCNAYTIMKMIPDFGCLIENHHLMRQIFNASAAAGMAACFNCPLGGVLFSIEVTSSYYLLANYWRSFMAATAGAVLYDVILWWRGIDDSRPFPIDYVAQPYMRWEFPLYFFLGVIGGIAAYLYLHMQQQWFLFIRKYSVAQPVALAAVVGAFCALMTFAVGSYTAKGVTAGAIFNDLIKSGKVGELDRYDNVSRIGGLFATLIIRVMVTILATTLRIPAGFFTPMIMIGAIIGRIFGQCVQQVVGSDWNIYVQGYALVGACAFASGTTHTISAAVVILESTGQLSMFLPCLIGAIVGSGIVKGHTVSLYNQGLINKGLESFEQLLLESGDFNNAQDMMDKKAVYVTRNCQVGDLVALMQHGKLATFAVIDSIESCKLIGSLSRKDVFAYLKKFYSTHGLAAFVRQMMPEDTKQDDYRMARRKKMESRTQWLRTQIVLPSEVADEAALNAAAANPTNAAETVLSIVTSPFASLAAASGSSHGTASAAATSNAVQDTGRARRVSSLSAHHEIESDEGERSSDEEEQHESDAMGPVRGRATSFGIELPNALTRRRSSTTGSSSSGPTAIQIDALIQSQGAIGSAIDQQLSSSSASHSTSFNTGSAMPPSGFGRLNMSTRFSEVLKSKNKKMRESLAHMDEEQVARAQLLLKHTIDILQEELLPLNVDPFTVHSTSGVDQVYMLFNNVKANCVFVVEEDQVLLGMISQENLMQRLKKTK